MYYIFLGVQASHMCRVSKNRQLDSYIGLAVCDHFVRNYVKYRPITNVNNLLRFYKKICT